ncbi:hypothetical protein CMI37_20400 [Candidatus Pacearchaeota archaeon]|nr:hypothetical protein [Candidatus Pacearchaeota archaeon]
MIVWLTGNSGAGKTTQARKMMREGDILLDGDELRECWPELGFSSADRWISNIRTAHLAKMLEGQGFRVYVATICPYRMLRDVVHGITGCRFLYLGGGQPNSEEYPYEPPTKKERLGSFLGVTVKMKAQVRV